jgi:iron(III) transport system ATP-binding protein
MKTSDLPLQQDTSWLQFQSVSKRFGQFQALHDVNLTIRKGEFLCLLGPSGCGKTTLLRILAGLEQQDSGSLVMGGHDISHLPPAQRQYGIVFQSYALFPNLTVAENIGYGLRDTRARKMARVEELLDLIGLQSLEQQFPAQLSGGQQQRVALARALATSPSLLLLDEPLSALDAQVREHLRRELRSLQEKLGVTTIMVTHDQEEAVALADTIAVMRAGKVEQTGTPEQIYHQPATTFVADFIGRANWLEVAVDHKGRVTLAGMEFSVSTALADRSLFGGTARLFCRPEDVHVLPHWQHDAHTWMAVVEKVDFVGGMRRALLSLCNAREIRVWAELGPNDAAYHALIPGQRVPMQLPAGRLCLFPPERA